MPKLWYHRRKCTGGNYQWQKKKIPERSEIREEDKWAIHDIYATDELWEEDLKKIKDMIPQVGAFAGKLGESADTLLAFVKWDENTTVLFDALGNYAMRRSDEDARVSKYQAMVGNLMSTVVELNAAASFATPEIMAIDDETMEKFYAEQPKLEHYRRHLNNIRRRRAHFLSPPRKSCSPPPVKWPARRTPSSACSTMPT